MSENVRRVVDLVGLVGEWATVSLQEWIARLAIGEVRELAGVLLVDAAGVLWRWRLIDVAGRAVVTQQALTGDLRGVVSFASCDAAGYGLALMAMEATTPGCRLVSTREAAEMAEIGR